MNIKDIGWIPKSSASIFKSKITSPSPLDLKNYKMGVFSWAKYPKRLAKVLPIINTVMIPELQYIEKIKE